MVILSPIGPDGTMLAASNFERATLNWKEACKFPYDFKTLSLPRASLKLFSGDCNEATIARGFWLGVLNCAIFAVDSSNDLRLNLLWDYCELLTDIPPGQMEFVALISGKLGEDSFVHPLLMAEHSVHPHTENLSDHKAFVKMGMLLSNSCCRLAKKLIEVGRDPLVARSYGLLVGGTKARLLIAHPVITKFGEEFEVHASIHSWVIDALGTDPLPTPGTCEPQESIIASEGEINWAPVNSALLPLSQLKSYFYSSCNDTFRLPRDSIVNDTIFAQATFLSLTSRNGET